jgi:hypothetical protein
VRPLAKARPQRWVHDCVACEGVGVTTERDYDDEGVAISVRVECEGCSGCGKLAACDLCDEPIPLSDAELLGYVCGPCRGDLENRDQDVERARLRRWVA